MNIRLGTVPILAIETASVAEPVDVVRYAKYTSCGNTFLIIDEISTPLSDDSERAAFAQWALDGDFGIGGADNVLYLSRAGETRATDVPGADYVFRIFERDGTETLSCGNGLLSTAAELHRAQGGRRWGVLTEVPSGRPRLVQIGLGREAHGTWVDMGWPLPVAGDLFRRRSPVSASGIDAVVGLEVPLPRDAAWALGLPEALVLSGWLVFTGEPHLVLISGRGLPRGLEERLFVARDRATACRPVGPHFDAALRASNLLVDHIGRSINRAYRSLFPRGVHVNFTRIAGEAGPIECRTYERAIDRETLSCGTGAVATAYVARQLGLVSGPETTIWPHRCRWLQPDASLLVVEADSGFVLSGRPRLVCAGVAAVPGRPATCSKGGV